MLLARRQLTGLLVAVALAGCRGSSSVPVAVEDAGAAEASTPRAPERVDPNNIEYWRQKVREVAAKGDEAKVAAARALVVDAGAQPAVARDDCQAVVEVAREKFVRGELASAEAMLRPLAGDDSPCLPARAVLAEILYRRGELKRAISIVEDLAKEARSAQETELVAALLARMKREQGIESRMTQLDSGEFNVSFDGHEDREVARFALDGLHEARRLVGQELGFFPVGAVQVIIYPSQTFLSATGAPEWSGGIYDGKVRVPTLGAKDKPARFRAALFHEYCHALVHMVSAGRDVPSWVNEGMAMRAERLAGGGSGRRFVRTRYSLLDLHGSFRQLQDPGSAYAASLAATDALVGAQRLSRMRELLEQVARGAPFPSAFELTFGRSYDAFVRERASAVP